MRQLGGQRQEVLHLTGIDGEAKNPISLVRLTTGIAIVPMWLTKGKLGRSSDT